MILGSKYLTHLNDQVLIDLHHNLPEIKAIQSITNQDCHLIKMIIIGYHFRFLKINVVHHISFHVVDYDPSR